MNADSKFASMENLFAALGEASVSLPGLTTSSKSYIVSRIYKRLVREQKTRHIVLITSDMKTSHMYADDLKFFCGEDAVRLFPKLTMARHDIFSSELDNIARRGKILESLPNNAFITVVPIVGLLQKTLPRDMFNEYSFLLMKERDYEREKLINRLLSIGYTNSPVVENIGEFSIRGGLLDIYSPCESNPVRIEFFGDTVDSLRFFDPESQITLRKKGLKKLKIIPVREVAFTEENVKYAKASFKAFGDANEIPKQERDKYLLDIENRIYFSGIDYFLSFFEKNLVSPLTYFPEETLYFLDDILALEDRAAKYRLDEVERFEEALGEKNFYPVYGASNITISELLNIPKSTLYFDTLELEDIKRPRLRFDIAANSDLIRDMKDARFSADAMLKPLTDRLTKWEQYGYHVNFVSRTLTQSERLSALLADNDFSFKVAEGASFKSSSKNNIYIGKLESGFKFYTEKLVFITDEEIFGERKHVSVRKVKSKTDAFLTSFSELKVNDCVVHVDHGIGAYRGMTRMGDGDIESDFLTLEYRDGDKLYIPVYRLNVIQKYTGGGTPILDKLGGVKWLNTKKRVKESLFNMAEELLRLFAAREKRKGFKFSEPDSTYRSFEATFPFEETPDQLTALEDITNDLVSTNVTDRLICGDVGYGKTEVAIRAAFIAALSSKQVAVLVPTTLLAEQHYRNFKNRLKGFPVEVGMLSRFLTKKEAAETVEMLGQGRIDIIIGTHRLLSEDVKFRNLGLIIIDEEQRFGVRHKERLKDYRSLVDVITLTATPIPRTLHLSLLGIRDISVINTPPVDRLSVRTYVTTYNEKIIQEAVQRERRRGGQIFFLHNKVQTINTMAEHLHEILPGVKIGVAHGQMSERQLERIMRSFVNREYDLLVTSTIIENGIDIPTTNTMIINRADTFGLSQLYQLRGRVGRAKERAYCYLFIPEDRKITSEAKRRLQVIKEHSELGAGFRIASHDLELRGGGNILGKEQSGHIEELGFDLYTKLLEETISEIKGEEKEKRVDPEINLNIPAFIPDSYINDISLKLLFYKRISSTQSEEDLDKLEEEFRDRFGPLPDEVTNLFWIVAIKLNLMSLNVTSIKSGNKKFVLTFNKDNPDISGESLVHLVTHIPRKYAITPDYKLIINLHDEDPRAILHEIRNLMNLLEQAT